MDRGAHFYKSDFQIHSPRDACWTGLRPTSPEGRLLFAQGFVNECRQKALRAVAITDHHDICFIKYAQLAAQSLDLTGFNPASFIPDPSQQNPIIFPGVELTLQLPCQAIVLLDSSAGIEIQESLLHLLGLVPLHPDEEEQGPQVQRLPFGTLNELDDKLRENAALKGRYIILPNLNEGGQDTLIRNGFHHHYVAMRCVGGYTEKNYSDFSSGHLNKLNGGDENFGSKPVGIFQTSDSRRSDFKHLACRTTWVKMAEPTAEGLRQACLSRESRLFQIEPRVPTRYISRVEITSSVYLGALDQELNPQFNAFIGGRGTGKSTFLEFIRWAMQDQSIDIATEDGVDRKRQQFLNALSQVGGTVRVHWNVDGTPHVVIFDPSHNVLKLKVAGETERDVSVNEVKLLLPIRAYSQKQLSSVSGKRSELQRFVEEPIRDKLRSFENDFEAQRAAIRTHYTNRRRRRDLLAQVQLQQTHLGSIQERIRTLQSGLLNLPPEAERAMREHSGRLQEDKYINANRERLAELLSILARFQPPLRPALPEVDTPQKPRLSSIEAQIDICVDTLLREITNAKTAFELSLKAVRSLIDEWREDHGRHIATLVEAQRQQRASAVVLHQLSQLRINEANADSEINRLQKLLVATPDGEAALPAVWEIWIKMHLDRFAVLAEQCRVLSRQSGNKLEVELQAGRDIEAALKVLEAKLQGARIHPNRWDTLKTWLSVDGMTVQRWRTFCNELLALVESEGAADIQAAPLPTLPSWELTDQMRAGIRQMLSFDGWLELATLTIQDVPNFYYTGGGTRIPFEQASAGQQATVLLTLLLKDADGPLLIDQPEDDLDNDVIGAVVENILRAKQDRQLIFASHNANLVVNGDAELVVRFKSVTQDGSMRGVVDCQGAIDCRPVREAITEVMEGGRKAFELRRQKYGF